MCHQILRFNFEGTSVSSESQIKVQARRISSDYFSGVCGTVAVVDGTYAYHHYMQDNFNDDVSMCQSFSIATLDASQSTDAQVNGCFQEGRMKITTFLGFGVEGLGVGETFCP